MRVKRLTKPLMAFLFIAGLLFSSSFASNAAPKNVQNKDASFFWTADKINNAMAFDMVFENGSKVGKRVPSIKSTGQPGGAVTTNSVLGTSWNNGGLPLTASGKIFFSIGSNNYQCSGALIKDNKIDRSVVLTAGHCVYDNATGYVTNWIFIPSYDINLVSISGCTTSTTNCWPAEALYAHSGFTSQSSFTTAATLYDWGFAKITALKNGLLPDGGDKTTTEGTNSFDYSFQNLVSQTQISSFGYPASGKYKGKDLVYSSGKLTFDVNNSNNTYSLASDMTAGCSGGPWLSAISSSLPYAGILSSVNSYKYGTTKYIYGPKFNGNTLATFNSALT